MILKKLIFVFLVSVIYACSTVAQTDITWIKQFTFPPDYRINTISFIDSLQGWAGGWKRTPQISGLIVHTEDGGTSWSEQLIDSSFSTTWFNDLQFLDKDHGWAAGLHILYKTDDGGQNWSKIPDSLFISQKSPILNGLGDMQSVSFVDLERGMVSGTEGLIISTMDRGETWLNFTLQLEEGFIDTLHFVAIVKGDTACGVGNGGIAVTIDGGASWQIKHSEFRNYKKCIFVNEFLGWTLSSDAQILRTEDAGQTWQDLGRIYQDFVQAIDMEFIDEMTGWVITSAGTIWKTEDGGFSWNEDTVSTNAALTSVDFIQEEIGFVTDVRGSFFRTKPDQTVKVDHKLIRPLTFALLPSFPNPFNPETTLRYRIPKQQRITLTIYNLLGEKIVTLADGVKIEGEHTIRWNGENEAGRVMPSGVYFAVLKSAQTLSVQKMLLIP